MLKQGRVVLSMRGVVGGTDSKGNSSRGKVVHCLVLESLQTSNMIFSELQTLRDLFGQVGMTLAH